MSELIQARNIQSEIAYRETSGDLNKQQAANLRAVEPHLAAEMLAKIDRDKEAAGASRAQRISTETLLPERVAQERAQTEQYKAQTERVRTLLPYEQRRIDADITQSLAAANASNTNAANAKALFPLQYKELENRNNEYITMQADGKTYTAKGIDVLRQREENLRAIARLTKEHESRIAAARKDKVLEQKTSLDAEQNILAKKPGNRALSDSDQEDELMPEAELFHATSRQPYVYVFEDNTNWAGYGSKVKKHQLPVVNGHQYTAQEIYDAAHAEGRNMTTQQYLEEIFYPSPALKQQAPWKRPQKPAQ